MNEFFPYTTKLYEKLSYYEKWYKWETKYYQ